MGKRKKKNNILGKKFYNIHTNVGYTILAVIEKTDRIVFSDKSIISTSEFKKNYRRNKK